jgi:hypothetical protein
MSCDADRKGHRQGQQREGAQRFARRRGGQGQQRHRQRQLREHHPAAPPPATGQVEAVHQRRPDELEGVGQAHQGEEADVGDRQTVHRQPGLHGLPGECQRQARREAQRGHGQQPVQPSQAPVQRLAGDAPRRRGRRAQTSAFCRKLRQKPGG